MSGKVLLSFLGFGLSLFVFSKLHGNDHGKLKKQITEKRPSKIWVLFELRKKASCPLNYTDKFLSGKLLVFNNTGNKDSTILKVIESDSPVTISGSFINLKNDSLTVNYNFLVSPGDTLRLSFNDKGFLNTKKCKIRNVISDSSNVFFKNRTFLPQGGNSWPIEQKWDLFYSSFNSTYKTELERINKLLSDSQIDSVSHAQLILNCRLHYYKRLFEWYFSGNNQYLKAEQPVISNILHEMESVLNDSHIFLSKDLLPVMDGMVRAQIINRGNDYVNSINVYKQALAANLGKYKPGYLTVCITRSAVKSGSEFDDIAKDYHQRVPRAYYIYTDSVLKANPEQRVLTSKNLLKTLNGQSASWDNLIRSKKHFLIIDLWASWCAPCRAQLPYIDSLRLVFKGYPVEFIAINIDENPNAWKIASDQESKYLKINNYHLIGASKSNIVHQLNVTTIPRYVVLKDAKVLSADFYYPSEPSFANELKKLIGKRDN